MSGRRSCTPGSSSSQATPPEERGALAAQEAGGKAVLLCVTIIRDVLWGTFSLDNHVQQKRELRAPPLSLSFENLAVHSPHVPGLQCEWKRVGNERAG